jgi:hypothetical protein
MSFLLLCTGGLLIGANVALYTHLSTPRVSSSNEKTEMRQFLKFNHLDLYFSKEAQFLRLRSDFVNQVRDDAPLKYIMNTLFEIKMNPFYDSSICAVPMRNLIILDITNAEELGKHQLEPDTKCLKRLQADKCPKKELLLDMMQALGEY